ncbi:unnamed protein product [Allacma fusca]|uniref:Uncharacterized protein n=1 Tax=Allacma fusca TaxID=39272 RepID=A0A8J2PWT9_9HEXA|nr:unnamed protein product [Allacma fusca]
MSISRCGCTQEFPPTQPQGGKVEEMDFLEDSQRQPSGNSLTSAYLEDPEQRSIVKIRSIFSIYQLH